MKASAAQDIVALAVQHMMVSVAQHTTEWADLVMRVSEGHVIPG